MGDSESIRAELPEAAGEGHATPPAAGTNRLAIVSLGLAISGPVLFFSLPGFSIPLAVWLVIILGTLATGHLAIGQIKRTGKRGGRIAVTGLFLGYASAALVVFLLVLSSNGFMPPLGSQ